jgi:hypothetical protein
LIADGIFKMLEFNELSSLRTKLVKKEIYIVLRKAVSKDSSHKKSKVIDEIDHNI